MELLIFLSGAVFLVLSVALSEPLMFVVALTILGFFAVKWFANRSSGRYAARRRAELIENAADEQLRTIKGAGDD